GILLDGTSAGNTPYWDGSAWVVNSDNIYNNGGNIGIGTNSPSAKLEVQGSVLINPSYGNFRLAIPGGDGWQFSTVGGGQNLQLWNVTGGSANTIRMFMEGSTGNVGIGTTTPLARLDVRKATSGMVAAFHAPSSMYIGLYEGINYRGYIGSFYGNDEDIDIGS